MILDIASSRKNVGNSILLVSAKVKLVIMDVLTDILKNVNSKKGADS